MPKGKDFNWPSPEKVEELYRMYGTDVKTGEALGVSGSAVRHYRHRHKISANIQHTNPVERAMADAPEPSNETVAERALADKVLALEASRAEAQGKLRAMRRRNEELEQEAERLGQVIETVREVRQSPAPPWLKPKGRRRRGDHHGTILASFSDFHIGESVNPDEMNGYNAYSAAIAEQRVQRWGDKVIDLSRQYLAGVTYDGIVVPNLGDTISGQIHEELAQTNELSNYKAVPLAVTWLTAVLGVLADEFGRVHVPSVPGNHPRDSRKPRFKKRAEHSADTLISVLTAERFADDERVTFHIPESLDADFNIYETRFKVEHGDAIMSKGGGVLGPFPSLIRHAHKRRQQAQAEGTPFDYLMMGHWHTLQPLLAYGLIVNGSGKGYDEYARGNSLPPEQPQQFLGIVTPERGLTGQYPVFVGKRSAEGW